MQERNLISGNFKNIGNETRFIHMKKKSSLGIFDRFQNIGNSIGVQGEASNGNDANFEFINSQNNISSDLRVIITS